MNTIEEIRAALAELTDAMVAKGIKTPLAEAHIGDISDWVSIRGDYYAKQLDGEYIKFFQQMRIAEAIAAARAYIAALPDPATEGERKFTRALADAVDIAIEYALPDAAVLPVRAAIREVNAVLLAAPAREDAQ